LSSKVTLVLALLNGTLYCCVLPLWEGFDEPFHYAYVQSVARSHTIPVVNRTPISLEVRESLEAVPLSRLLSQVVPGSLSFEEWSKLSEAQKLAHRNQLRSLTREMGARGDTIVNYEAQQAPLAYFVYAPFDWLLSYLALPSRILCLRMLGTIAATVSIFFALDQLAGELSLSGVFRIACFAVIVEGQMLWASIAHMGNDVFAIPLTVWFLARLVSTARNRSSKNVLIVSALFAAGLLAKAYFLAFAPLLLAFWIWLVLTDRISWKTSAIGAVLVMCAASAWYLRNLLLYGSISGTQQSVAGVGFRQAVAAFPHINWFRSLGEFAMWSMWTGNWSFLSFSKATLWAELLLLSAAFLTYLLHIQRIAPAALWALAGSFLFGSGLVYQTCVTWVHTAGESTHPEPWYGQGVLIVLIVLCFRGLSLTAVAGRAIAAALSIIAAWIAAMTYLAKLLPYYGGAVTRSNVRTLWAWWRAHPTQDLSTVTLAPPGLVYALLALFTLLLVIVTAKIVLLLQSRPAIDEF
jgi:hypothetical protein